jgi:hypothetical protein
MREIAITYAHSVEAFGIGNMDDAGATADKDAVHRVEQLQDLVRCKVLDDVHENHSIAGTASAAG